MTSRWVRWLALLGMSLAYPAAAAAHGGDARIVRVAAVDDGGAPWLLQLSDGLALRQPEGWRFLCPAALEASAILHALSADGRTAWAATLRNVFRITSDGKVDRRPGQCGDTPVELVAHREAVYMLARDSARGRFVVCELEETGLREVYASELAVDDLTSDGTDLWLARTDRDEFELESIGSGELRSYREAVPHHAVRLAYAQGSLYAGLIDFGRTTLARLSAERAEMLLDSTSPLYGPVESSGVAYAGTEGKLYALDGSRLAPIDTALVVDEVDSLSGHGFAFAEGAVYGLPVVSDPSGALFAIDSVTPPVEVPTEACSEQWQRFALELHGPDHLVDAAPLVDSDVAASGDARDLASRGPQSTAGGCNIGGGAARSSPVALAVCFAGLLLARRRNRRAPR